MPGAEVHAYDLGAHVNLCGAAGHAVADLGAPGVDWTASVTCRACLTALDAKRVNA